MNTAEIPEKTLRISGVVKESITDGPGIRFTVFAQGCPHGCAGCHNPDTHDPAGGYDCEISVILSEFLKNPLLKGMTLSGGEPTEQAEAFLPLAHEVVRAGKDIAIFSGYTFEELLEMGKTRPAVTELLALCRFLVDGRFIENRRNLTLTFRGSENQRIIDAAASLEQGKPVVITHLYDGANT